ncbi:MAG TPA: T9SS type A sorting domain-containing protein [Flavobacteriales bacterium]|nr:T9SS type A sorting domain-containing protein [Flavobacteriales bacterium]HIN40729.1 T9SS type A sorting domain-containing protein [Flavobacteriales bacterium]
MCWEKRVIYNASGLPKGLYLIEIRSENENKVYKFIK